MNISINKLSHIIFIFITLASLTIMISCSSEEEIVVRKEENEQTVIMFSLGVQICYLIFNKT